MPTITATADNTRSQVRLDLDFSDIDAPYVLVNRVDSVTGASTQVRGHGASFSINGVAYAPMQAGYKAVLYDTEAPLDSTVYYTASAPVVTMNANPDFNTGYVDPWYPATPTLLVFPSSSLGGEQFMSLNPDGVTANPSTRGEDIPATPGASFTVTGTFSGNVTITFTMGLSFRDNTGAIISSTSAAGSALGSTVVTSTGVAPAGTVSAQPYITFNSTPGAAAILSINQIAVTTSAGTATSGGVTLMSLGAARLKDPLRPGNNVRIDFLFDPNPLCIPGEGIFWQSMDSEDRAANAATFNVNNQDTPIVVSKVRSAPTSTLTLVSRTFADRDRLVALLAPGSPVLFQAPDEYGVPDRYLSVGNDSVGRIMPDHRFPIRVFSLPHTVVNAPAGPSQGTVGARWSDQCNRYVSWGAVTTAGLTWTQILDGAAG